MFQQMNIKSRRKKYNGWLIKIGFGIISCLFLFAISNLTIANAETTAESTGTEKNIAGDTGLETLAPINYRIIQTDENGDPIKDADGNPIGEIDFSLPVRDPSVAKTDFDELLKNVSTNRPLKPSSSNSKNDGVFFENLNADGSSYFTTAFKASGIMNSIELVLNNDTDNGKNFVYDLITSIETDHGMPQVLSGNTLIYHLVYEEPYSPLKVNITEEDTNKKSLGNDTSFNLEIGSSNATVTNELPDLVKNLSDKSVVLSSAKDTESYYDVANADGTGTTTVPLTNEILQGYEKDGISFTNSGKSIATAIIRDLALKDINQKYAGQIENIHLVYKADTNSSSGGNSGNSESHVSSNSSNSSGPTVDREVEGIEERISTYHDSSDVKLYDDNGSELTDRKLAPNSDWFTDESITLNGVKYYRVATNQWAKAKDVYLYYDNVNNVRVNEGSTAGLVKDNGKDVTDRALQAGSSWYTDRYIYINNVKYYRVATNEFVSSNNVQEY